MADKKPVNRGPALQSMTGFARAEQEYSSEFGEYRWTWEVRSLNSKGLDIKCRFPSWLDNLETEVRKLTTAKFSRGSVNVGLQLRSTASEARLQLNEEALAQVIEAAEIINSKMPCAPPSVDGILALRGVLNLEEIEQGPDSRKELIKALLVSFAECLDELEASRAAEGQQLKSVISEQIRIIQELTAAARKTADTVPATIHARLAGQLEALTKGSFPDDRIAQEVALLAAKADVREELDRLDAHVDAANSLLFENIAIGRRFDFLTQEFNREANTLCSKAQSIELKTLGLDLKATIDQLREQIQNVE